MGLCLSVIQPQPEVPQVGPHPAQRLSQVDPATIPNVLFKGETIDARILEVHDGDTCTVLVMHGNQPMKMHIRILGVDTPEITGGHGRMPEEKVAATKARDFVRGLLQGTVKLRIEKYDKFGSRMDGIIFLPDGTNLSELLVSKGYAKQYHGEKKSEWTLEELTSGPYA